MREATDNNTIITAREPLPQDISFWNKEKEIGRLSFRDGKLEFTGNAKESAMVFIRWLKELWGVTDFKKL